MKVKQKKWIRIRIYGVALFFLCGLGVILARVYQLQVLDQAKLRAIAQNNVKGTVKLPPKRGTIYDRDGHELAVSIEVASIYAHPSMVQKKKVAAKRLSRILNLKRHKIFNLLNKRSPFVWIQRRISPEKAAAVKRLKLSGIGTTKESGRYYPGREIAGHLIGFSGTDNQGLEGLERLYDDVLKGPQTILFQMHDALGRPFFISKPNMEGDEVHDLVLTIDKDIQYRAERSLNAAVKERKAKSGQCIVMDPRTGEILAMAVAPSFNPNIFNEYRPYQWRNRTITDTYEPGSTLKAFLLAAALQKKAVHPGTRFYCEQGTYKVANHIIHDTKKYGSLTVAEIVTRSSNIGAVKMGRALGYAYFEKVLRDFGFGSKTHIDLLGESKGFVRPFRDAKEIDQANIYFGQGLSANSIQLVTAMAALANDGVLMRPYVIKAVQNKKGRVIQENHPRKVRRVVSSEVARETSRILEGVVGEWGTAPMAAITGYQVAGKTGTSQKIDPKTKRYSKRDYMSIFVGFVPTDRPRLVILVVLDEPRGVTYGGWVAGPVFKEVGQWALSHLRVNPHLRIVQTEGPPQDIKSRASGRPQKDWIRVQNKGTLPDFSGRHMREVLRWTRAQGMKLLMDGTGVAVRQSPKPGAILKGIKVVKVHFQP